MLRPQYQRENYKPSPHSIDWLFKNNEVKKVNKINKEIYQPDYVIDEINFLRLLKDLFRYSDYVTTEDIIKNAKEELGQSFISLFKSRNFNDFMLRLPDVQYEKEIYIEEEPEYIIPYYSESEVDDNISVLDSEEQEEDDQDEEKKYLRIKDVWTAGNGFYEYISDVHEYNIEMYGEDYRSIRYRKEID